ncbi:unnamed protein product, partial [Discosporangium mesarthrocarpum]
EPSRNWRDEVEGGSIASVRLVREEWLAAVALGRVDRCLRKMSKRGVVSLVRQAHQKASDGPNVRISMFQQALEREVDVVPTSFVRGYIRQHKASRKAQEERDRRVELQER